MTVTRADEGLAFILRFENVAWYEQGVVRILDRRIYPIRTEFVTCRTHFEVARAIADMVTQSGGPYTAAGMGMVLAAYESRDMAGPKRKEFLEEASRTLSRARPTTTARMEHYTQSVLDAALAAMEFGKDVIEAAFAQALDDTNKRYLTYRRIGKSLASLIPNGGTMLTQCWAETVMGMVLRECRVKHKKVKVFCAETRPYFQGARLTASCVRDMGFDVTVICDNMTAYTMQQKGVDLFTSAADVICMDGHVVNKVGTFQMALAAHYYGIPYYVTGNPNRAHASADSVTIEERDGDLVLHAMDIKLTMDGVKGYYPAFDITPPELVTSVITDRGMLKADELHKYFSG